MATYRIHYIKKISNQKKRFWLQRWSLAHSQMPYRKSNKQSIQYYFKTVYFQIHVYLQFNPNLGNRGLFWYWDASGVPSLRLWNRPPWLHGDILWAMKLKWSPWVWLRIFLNIWFIDYSYSMTHMYPSKNRRFRKFRILINFQKNNPNSMTYFCFILSNFSKNNHSNGQSRQK